MKFLPVIKRVAPFFATLVFGIFITSLFVPLRTPQFEVRSGDRNHCRDRHRGGKRMMRFEFERMSGELERMNDENMRLRNRVEELESRDWVRESPLDVPPPPPAPRPFGAVPKREQ